MWKAQGRMMQMVKQASEPMSDMTLSKDGTKMAIITKARVTTTRMVMRRTPRPSDDIPPREDADGSARASRPKTISSVETIGRALLEKIVST